MTFGAPAYLGAIPVLVGVAVWLARRTAAARAALPGTTGELDVAAGGTSSRHRPAWRRRCEWTGGVLIVAGLALPRFEVASGAAPKPALLLVDVSRSMLAEDASGSRFARAKEAVAFALGRLSGRRVGLIAFAGANEEVAPPTTDFAALLALLDELDPRRTLDPGSDAAAAIEKALERLQEGGDLVVLSDGEWDGDARREVALGATAVRRSVAIHVVPLGGAAPVGLVQHEADGSALPIVDGEGQPAVTRADRARMVALADAARGHVVADVGAADAFAFLAPVRDESRASEDFGPGLAPGSVALALALALLAIAHGLRERTT